VQHANVGNARPHSLEIVGFTTVGQLGKGWPFWLPCTAACTHCTNPTARPSANLFSKRLKHSPFYRFPPCTCSAAMSITSTTRGTPFTSKNTSRLPARQPVDEATVRRANPDTALMIHHHLITIHRALFHNLSRGQKACALDRTLGCYR
jgi:hypothetical protein